MSKIKTSVNELTMTEEFVDNLEQQTEERNEGEGKNKFFIYNFDF